MDPKVNDRDTPSALVTFSAAFEFPRIAVVGNHLFYHPEPDAVVVVNSDISSGDCSEDKPSMTDGPQGIPCQDPVVRINSALFEALGRQFPLPPQ